MKLALFAMLLGTIPAFGDVKLAAVPKKVILEIEGGFTMSAERDEEGTRIELRRGTVILRVPIAETTELGIGLGHCEICFSEVPPDDGLPKEIELRFKYGEVSDPFEGEYHSPFGTVRFRFEGDQYRDRTREDLTTGEVFLKQPGKREVRKNPPNVPDPFK